MIRRIWTQRKRDVEDMWVGLKPPEEQKNDSLRHFISFFSKEKTKRKRTPKTKAGPPNHSTKYINPETVRKIENKRRNEIIDSQLLHAKFEYNPTEF